MNKIYRPIKLEDLAKKLKVSKVTISKALRDHPDISAATTAKVKELADKMGYMPNVMAKNLSARKSNNIGLVVPKIAHFFFASVIESIYNTAFENNYEIVLTVSQEQSERERKHILSLLSMRVDGLLVSVTQETKDTSIFERVANSGVPLVFIDRVPSMPGISSVTVNDIEGAYSAIDYAIKKGYTKIAHIGGYKNINIGRARYEGFLKAMRFNRIPINNNWVIEGGFGEEDGYNGFKKIYEKKNIPEYIFAATYPIALGIYAAANEYGLSIPEDIEVTCFGKNTFNRFTPTVFNFIDQPTQELGHEAVKLMIEQINNPEARPKNIILNTELIISNTNSKKEVVG
jgi:LacI family transcriptional regulator